MFLAGINFILSYFALTGKIKKVFQDEEFRFYSRMVLTASVLVGTILFFNADLEAVKSFEHPKYLEKPRAHFDMPFSSNCCHNNHWFCYL